MGVRIGGAIAAAVIAVFLIFAILPALDGPEHVGPTGGVLGGPADDLPDLAAAGDVLADRTALQRWRAISGPSPEGEISQPVVSASEGGET